MTPAKRNSSELEIDCTAGGGTRVGCDARNQNLKGEAVTPHSLPSARA